MPYVNGFEMWTFKVNVNTSRHPSIHHNSHGYYL